MPNTIVATPCRLGPTPPRRRAIYRDSASREIGTPTNRDTPDIVTICFYARTHTAWLSSPRSSTILHYCLLIFPTFPSSTSFQSVWKRCKAFSSFVKYSFELELSQEISIDIERIISTNIENLKKKMVRSIWQIYGCYTFYSILLRANQNRVKIHRIVHHCAN